MRYIMSDILEAITKVPVESHGWDAQPAAYVFHDRNGPYYVGQSTDLRIRFYEHKRAGLSLSARHVEVLPVYSAVAARRLERNLMLLLMPRQNSSNLSATVNEMRWYNCIWAQTLSERADGQQELSWCWECGELLVERSGVSLSATSHPEPGYISLSVCAQTTSSGIRRAIAGRTWRSTFRRSGTDRLTSGTSSNAN